MKRHEFEGELLTMAEIHRRVPALSITALRDHLRAGRNTRQAILTYRFDFAAAARKTNARQKHIHRQIVMRAPRNQRKPADERTDSGR